MKKLLILLSLSFSVAASAQVDPAFTTKVINVVNTAAAYYQNQNQTNLQAAYNAATAFYPMTETQFNSKLSAMLNSSAQMARFTSPITFVQCLATAAGQYNACINAANNVPSHFEEGQTYDIPPDPPVIPQSCTNAYQSSIIQCAITHLTH